MAPEGTPDLDTTRAPDLDAMLREARAAQDAISQPPQDEAAATDQSAQDEQSQAAATTDGDLDAQLQERDTLTVDRRAAEDERLKAAEILDSATELSEGSETLAPETERLLEVAGRTVDQRRADVLAVQEQLITMDADPAVRAAIWQEALDEKRRIDLRAEYEKSWDVSTTDGEHKGSLSQVLFETSEECTAALESGDRFTNPINQLENFAGRATSRYESDGPTGTLEDAEDAVGRISAIRAEAESGNPDTQKIDTLLAEFLYGRLEHFYATLDQRLGARAQQLFDNYQADPDAAKRYGVTDKTVEDWKDDLQRTGRVSDYGRVLAKSIMEGEGLKSKRLAKIGNDIYTDGKSGLKSSDNDPFSPDEYKAPATDQIAA